MVIRQTPVMLKRQRLMRQILPEIKRLSITLKSIFLIGETSELVKNHHPTVTIPKILLLIQ
jgi:hypothetical protein